MKREVSEQIVQSVERHQVPDGKDNISSSMGPCSDSRDSTPNVEEGKLEIEGSDKKLLNLEREV